MGNGQFMNNQYIQYPLKRSLKPRESISAIRSMVGNTNRVFTLFWFCTNCTNFAWLTETTYPAVSNSSLFFHQNFHLNLLRCRCRRQTSTNSYNKTLEHSVTKVRDRVIKYGSRVTLQLRDKGYTWCYRVCEPDVIKFSNRKQKSHLRFYPYQA